MKKTNILKIAFTLVLAFIITGAFAQVNDGNAVEGAAGAAAGQSIDSVIVGATAPYWAEPDPYYHTDYNPPAPAWNITDGFQWNWDIPTNPGGATINAAAPPQTVVDTNYVQITFPATGLYKLSVNEQAPAASGGCSGDDTTMSVRVIAAPIVANTADNDGGGILGIDLNVCEGAARTEDVVSATFTGDVPTYQLDWDLEIYTLDGGSPDEWFAFDKTTSLGAAQAWAIDEDFAGGDQQAGITTTDYALDKPGGGWTVINSKSTVYVYTIRSCAGRISRKSDYIANPTALATGWTPQDVADHAITIQINPAPVTGPIYHISNMWAN